MDISGALSQDVLVTYSYGFLFLYTLTCPLDKVRDREKDRKRESEERLKNSILFLHNLHRTVVISLAVARL